MEKIKFYPSIYNAEESNSMANRIVVSLDNLGIADEKLVLAKDDLKTHNLKLTNVINTKKKNPHTKELKERHKYRGKVFKCGSIIIDGYSICPYDDKKKEAALRLKEVIKRNGKNLHTFNYQKQSSAILSLLDELKGESNQKDLGTLGQLVWNSTLTDSQSGFVTVFNLKDDFKNKNRSIVKKEAHDPVNDSIERLITYINSESIFKKNDENWSKVYNSIEGIIKETSRSARFRRSGSHNHQEEVK